MSRETYSPIKKATRRDAKVGAKFVITLGYGPHVSHEARITARDTEKITFVRTWVRPGTAQYQPFGVAETMTLAEVSDLISRGIMRFQDFDRTEEPYFLKARPMTEAEERAADEREARWERFTQSETYRSM